MREPPCSTNHPATLAWVMILAAALTAPSAASAFCDLDYICGDGILVPQCEECDDGNLMNGDGCDANCRIENAGVCGNGILEDGEECDIFDLGGASCADLGCATGPVSCHATCLLDYSACTGCGPVCGDGVVDDGEECDDGNTTSGDGCDADCLLESLCGNGILDPGEECDDGNTTSGDGCDAGCANESVCGNGVVEIGEQCDDGNTTSGDGCDASCMNESLCGDGILEDGEECDGSELGGASCGDIACSTGTVSCFASCLLDYSGCTDCVVCADDVCEGGEDCHNCATDCPSFPTVLCGNGLCEAGDGENCVNCPEDCNGKQKGKASSRFCCGDGGGENPAQCPGTGRPDDPRCTSDGYDCTAAPMGTGTTCCGDANCQLPEDGVNCPLDCGPPPACAPTGEQCTHDEDCCSGDCNHGGNCK